MKRPYVTRYRPPLHHRSAHLLSLIRRRGGSWSASDGWNWLSPGEMRQNVEWLARHGYLRKQVEADGSARYYAD